MDAATTPKAVKVRRWLPYWAVMQADLHQTLCSWVYLTWVLVSVLAASGYLVYRLGIYQVGFVQRADDLIGGLLRWTILGSITLIIVLTAGSISAERGTMADSVLSRGISRYQYFLGKWHARLAAVLGTYFVMGVGVLAASFFLLDVNLSPMGSLVALATFACLLVAITTCGVTASAVFNSTVAAIAVLWVVRYGSGFVLSVLPTPIPSPDQVLTRLPHMLEGKYDPQAFGRLALWSAGLSAGVALFGMGYFARRDV
jgi:ABC-2 type transport system permease protein